ncbi:CDP-diacylglycerol--serine O-phosphatidyltransferase [Anaerobranca gottschalkii]|uniref:CDP-diacylglycerol--serine O-phosphatidyltransferase n=1 Tax=Anaerobranca gottschalkii DSM 13577 TaxID=1120990 RepID=A0A1I0B5I3_9FIRM|nr:CDP-diacylglycerol--serine O-phosphatidyltransferase [Anaerobranca gottschalkii]SET02048.1 CDP-diacylglycerol---serine O-phosphatidyltransferase [Anaerobranca gottschalkii DSM 13577]
MLMIIKRIIPSIFTLGNLIFGLIALLMIIEGNPNLGAAFIITGMLMDGLDGRIARALGVSSEFGKELDSLSDLVTFGVAPAFIAYTLALNELGLLGIFLSFAFALCGAIRLARFNVIDPVPGFFIGMPITMAGGILTIIMTYQNVISTPFLACITILLAYFMISTVKYPDFKKVGMSKFLQASIVFFFLFVIFVLKFRELIFFPVIIYILIGLKEQILILVRFYKSKRFISK